LLAVVVVFDASSVAASGMMVVVGFRRNFALKLNMVIASYLCIR
jgi:hypothetical protein